jgi:hypothetical protein
MVFKTIFILSWSKTVIRALRVYVLSFLFNNLKTFLILFRSKTSRSLIINLFFQKTWVDDYLYQVSFQQLKNLSYSFQVQDIAIRCIQKNVRKFMGVREWPWWRLLIKLTPMLNVHRTEDQLKSRTVSWN